MPVRWGATAQRMKADRPRGMAGQPEVEDFLAEVGERDRVVVEPGHERDSGPDVHPVVRGDAGLMRGQVREPHTEPESQTGEVLLPHGQDAGSDEKLADVESPPVLRAGRGGSRG